MEKKSVSHKLKRALIGKAKSPLDHGVFHKLSLIAFFAWVGLGADGLSSSCYGPEEAFLALHGHTYLSLFVALAAGLTVFLISSSYSQIIELFPTGGGGYLVARKLISPTVGMISGCALLIDYVLTITISVASGADALFSFIPPEWYALKLEFAATGVILLTLVNLRGVKESVLPLVPIFLVFVLTHAFVIAYALLADLPNVASVITHAKSDMTAAHAELGWFGIFFLLMRAYGMGAGTFTGIEAVSNGLPILRDPKVRTGKKTMRYMALSLAFTVMGLMLAYLLFDVHHVADKTLNAVLFEAVTRNWGALGPGFVWVALISEAALLFVAAQAGFLDGPRVLSNMALDRWFPTKFATLSDRLVTQNGILLMGIAALVTMVLTKGSVKILVVLYSINVFITFCLSQLGMVMHWWNSRAAGWRKKLLINGIGLILCTFILISVVVLKFHEGGWITLLITGCLIGVATLIKKHYLATAQQLHRLNELVKVAGIPSKKALEAPESPLDPDAKTAVLFVNGYNGFGLHTLFNVIRLFGGEFRNFVFVEVGVIDAGNFKGAEEVENLHHKIEHDVDRYVHFMRQKGCHAEGLTFMGVDVIEEVEKIGVEILEKYPNAVFFGGQLVFPNDSFFNRLLHNYTVFTMQRTFYQKGVPFVILPIRVT